MCTQKSVKYFELLAPRNNFSILADIFFVADVSLRNSNEKMEDTLKRIFSTLFDRKIEVGLPAKFGPRKVISVSQTLMRNETKAYAFSYGEKTFILPAIHHKRNNPQADRLLDFFLSVMENS